MEVRAPGPSSTQVVGPPWDGGDGELAGGWPPRLPGSGWGLPCSEPADGPGYLGSVVNYCSNGDQLLQIAPAEEIKCGRSSRNREQLRGQGHGDKEEEKECEIEIKKQNRQQNPKAEEAVRRIKGERTT